MKFLGLFLSLLLSISTTCVAQSTNITATGSGRAWLSEMVPISLASNLIYWFEAPASNALADFSKSRYIGGALSGAVWSAIGSGSVDCKSLGYVNIGTNAPTIGTNNMTLSAWIRFPNKAQAAEGIAGRNSNQAGYSRWGMYSLTNAPFNFTFGNSGRGSTLSNANIESNTWYMFTVSVRRSGNAVFYIDAVSNTVISVTLYATNNFNSLVPFRLGCYANNFTPIWFFSGQIDKVMIFDTVLSSQSITNLFQTQRKNKK